MNHILLHAVIASLLTLQWAAVADAQTAKTKPSVAQTLLAQTPLVSDPCLSRTKAIQLVPFKDPWPSARERYWDIDDNQFNEFVSHIGTTGEFTYSNSRVTLIYDMFPTAPYFVGRIEASGLKPNFAYQLKLAGKPARGPSTDSRSWNTHGDDVSNERLGYAGRWWCDSFHSSQTNFNDAHYTAFYKNTSPGSEHNIYGYIFMGDFVTDEFGNASVKFTGQSSYHITWQDKQNTSLKHVLAGSFGVQSARAPFYGYGAPLPRKDVKLWYEYEAGRAQNNVQLPAGRYNCRLLLTEESFHNSAGANYGGFWKTVLATEDFAKDANGDYLKNASGNLLPDSNSGNDIIFTIGVPTTPLLLTANPGDNSIALSWTGSASANNYIIKRALTGGGPYNTLAENITTTNYIDLQVNSGVTYYYVVIATNAVGESLSSNEAKAALQVAPLSAPANLWATPISNQIDLVWAATPKATHYIVKRALSANGPYQTIASRAKNTRYTDTQIKSGITYYYIVIAVNAAGKQSADSTAVSARIASYPAVRALQ